MFIGGNNLANISQMNAIAENCPKYERIVNENNTKSCKNCLHWSDNDCEINIYNEVLSSLDQT